MKSKIFALFLFLLPVAQVWGSGGDSLLIEMSYPGRRGSVPPSPRPTLGLALSGGGARGLAHIGVLKALEEAKIPIDYIAGTSMGAVVGGLYAAGYSPEKLEEIAKRVDWRGIFRDRPSRSQLFPTQRESYPPPLLQVSFSGWRPQIPQALTGGQKLTNLFTSLALEANYRAHANFDLLPIPFRAVATDLISGREIVLGRGDLALALRASIAIPLVFTPVQAGSLLLADGGLVDIIPVDVVRRMGAELVVAVDATAKLDPQEILENPWEIGTRSATIVFSHTGQKLLQASDLVIKPNLATYTSLDYKQVDFLIKMGEEAAKAKVPQIKRLLSSRSTQEEKLYSLVEVKKGKGLGGFSIKSGTVTSAREVRNGLAKLLSQGTFSQAKAILKRDPPGYSLSLQVKENPICRRIEITGNTIFAGEELKDHLSSREGERFNYNWMREDIDSLEELYRRRGYNLAQVEEATFDTTTGGLTYRIAEGRLAEVRLTGNRRTKRWVVLRYFPLKRGDLFNSFLAEKGLENAYATGLFDLVNLDVKRSPRGPILTISVREKGSVKLGLGVKYDNEWGQDYLFQITDSNILGIGNEVSLRLREGRREGGSLGFRADRIWRSYLTYRLQAYFRGERGRVFFAGRETGEFQVRRGGIFFSLGEGIGKLGTASLEGRVERVELRGISGEGYSTGVFSLRTISLRSIDDSVDRYPFPRRGRYHSLRFEFAPKWLGNKGEYGKATFTVRSYKTWKRRHTFYFHLRLGVTDHSLPFAEEFEMGGRKSLWGYEEDELRGNFLLEAGLAYRFKLFQRLYLQARFGLGNTWQGRDEVKLTSPLFGGGLGLALSTPLGPIEFDYGWHWKGRGMLYFSAGYGF